MYGFLHDALALPAAQAGRPQTPRTAGIGDDGTNDLLVSDVIRTGEMQAWFLAQGKAPLSVNSSAHVANLNASLLGGFSAGQFVHGGGQSRAFGFTMSTAID